ERAEAETEGDAPDGGGGDVEPGRVEQCHPLHSSRGGGTPRRRINSKATRRARRKSTKYSPASRISQIKAVRSAGRTVETISQSVRIAARLATTCALQVDLRTTVRRQVPHQPALSASPSRSGRRQLGQAPMAVTVGR